MVKTILSFILLYIGIEFIIIRVNAVCWDRPNPLRPWEKKVSSVCGFQEEITSKEDLIGNQTLATEDAFDFDFTCDASNQNLCNEVENIFKSAGQIIAGSINIVTPIKVNATYTGFCKALDECEKNIIGSASIARTIPLQDDDNIVRQYPQALAKQFLLSPQPQWGTYDIQALFNSDMDLFLGNGTIDSDQYDFKYVVLHELIHGLGFASSWNNYLPIKPSVLTPEPGFLDEVEGLDQPLTLVKFEELAFDKYMINLNGPSPKRMSDYATEINDFVKVNSKFLNVQDFIASFVISPQFKVSQDLMNDAQTPKAIAFQPQNGKTRDDLIFLETSIPYRSGSSISHMDYLTFHDGVDFLEVYKANIGQTLDQIVTANGGGTHPIGPKLQSVLETLGYASENNPNPYRPKSQDSSENNPNPNPSGSNSSNDPQESNPIRNKDPSVATFVSSSFDILSIFIIATITLLSF